jgi:transposase
MEVNMSYSLEIRNRALKAYKSGKKTQEEISDLFGISLSSFKRWLQKDRDGQSLIPDTSGGRPAKVNEEGLNTLKNLVMENPSITLDDLSIQYKKIHKIVVGRSILSRALKKLNLRYKKLSISSTAKDTEVVKKKEKTI